MKKKVLAAAVAATAFCAMAADGPDRAARTRKLVSGFKDSVATVAVYFKAESDGSLPQFSIPYLCPNCNSTHYRDADDYIKECRPFKCAGFFISADEVLVQDLGLRSSWIDRIEVRFGREQAKYPAVPSASFPGQGAVLLKTDRVVEGAKPLMFAEGRAAPENCVYFYLVHEDGFDVAGIRESKSAEFKHYVETGRDVVSGIPNTIVVGPDDRPVTVAMQAFFDAGGETMTPPSVWKRAPADVTDAKCAALEASLAESVVPVYIRLDAEEKSGRRSYYRHRSWSGSSGDAVGDENYVCGYVMDGGRILIPLKMTAGETARIAKMEATLPDGTKADLEFAGSVDKFGAVVAKFADGIPGGLKPAPLREGAVTGLFLQRVVCVSVKNADGKLAIKAFPAEVKKFSERFGEKLSFSAASKDDGCNFVFDRDGRLASVTLDVRSERRKYGGSSEQVYGEELSDLMAGRLPFNAELVPRTGEDRIRTAWLGVDVQQLTEAAAREKKASSFLHKGATNTDGALVSKVYPGSPADGLGIKEGDILLDMRIAGNENRKELEADVSYGAYDIDWDKVFAEAPLEAFDQVPITPWPVVDSGINTVCTEFGIGSRVIVAWVSGGVRKEGEVVLSSAPVYFRNAPKSRNKTVGLVVKDMTFEVRGYFRFSDDDPGVVIAKVKPGSPAAIAGLRPYELITEVDGGEVVDAKAFGAAIKDKKEFTLSVRRLSATRMVKISVK